MIKMILQRINNQKGFTLLELMVAISIIAILIAIVVPHFYSMTTKSENNIKIITQQEEKVVDEKAPSPPKQPEITKSDGKMNQL